jgi:phospholipase D1/2
MLASIRKFSTWSKRERPCALTFASEVPTTFTGTTFGAMTVSMHRMTRSSSRWRRKAGSRSTKLESRWQGSGSARLTRAWSRIKVGVITFNSYEWRLISPLVAIATPVPTKDGLIEEGDNKKVEEFKYPETEEEADEIIRRFEAASTRADDLVSGSVAHHALMDTTDLSAEKWLGTEEEERNWYGLLSLAFDSTELSCNSYITELCYIHSKVMIVDDRRVIVSRSS